MRARLILEDGTECVGTAFGKVTESIGEVVFNTGLTGYQEVLSDPSYCGQIVTMTYPLIGNYGINRDDFEAVRPYIHGFVVREHCDTPSNWRSTNSLDELLQDYGIPGIAGVDTRMLTRKLRYHGTMKGMITSSDAPLAELVAALRSAPMMTDQVARVSTKNLYNCPGTGHRVVLVDFGAKHGILRELTKRDCDVVVVPHDVTAEEISRLQPDGILLSNGPGDPKDVQHATQMIREVLGKYPIFGICLGHQLFALAGGADTTKLKFGHWGGNHPVKEIATGRTYITSQNHSYAVTADSLANTELIITHTALNDGTVEGLRHTEHPAFSVQYHPEAAPGPYDSSYLFDQFLSMMDTAKEGRLHAKIR
ncbi:glutamine-hydrolyzing carbamoyl-phosphate synthase small subunit [Brevibacillus ruminantium]|uniref:Carbamoyl phosphate synthase small chain n=1 Tax=Brevibacillus ruminantium TaxID=2950604 RepID=A0ABY4WN99_9BACL|nr:glutamine-hydrolyzing carbamoyl-phosphate synthase small subunit [Brevibacillus ruminantium]USG67613.1 glutamine-hydrolyzing carbamoyl-phosphate synthase small subunit [Brevibacillus ruminantium]